MVNPFKEVNWRPGLVERRKFAVSLMIGFPAIAVVLFVAGRLLESESGFRVPLILGGAGSVLGLILWLAPRIARPFYVVWYAVACGLGFVIGNVVLAAIFFLMIAPLGLTMRAFGRRSFSKGFDRRAPTYWHEAPPAPEAERYYRQY